MPKRDEDRLWELQFSTEVSTRYHDWRRSFLAKLVTAVRAITLAGSILSFVALFVLDRPTLEIVVAVATAIVGGVTLIDLVFKFDDMARLHNDLYRRFKRLQAEITRNEISAPDQTVAEWQAEAQVIRVDEPPTFWAVYAMSWNQTADRRRVEGAHFRHVARWRQALRNVMYFQPEDFPNAAV